MKQIYVAVLKWISYLSSDFNNYYFSSAVATLVVTIYQGITESHLWN
jgi:hypothetical protein